MVLKRPSNGGRRLWSYKVGRSPVCPPLPKRYVSTTQFALSPKIKSWGDGTCLFNLITCGLGWMAYGQILPTILHAKKIPGLSVILEWLVFKSFREMILYVPLKTLKKWDLSISYVLYSHCSSIIFNPWGSHVSKWWNWPQLSWASCVPASWFQTLIVPWSTEQAVCHQVWHKKKIMVYYKVNA